MSDSDLDKLVARIMAAAAEDPAPEAKESLLPAAGRTTATKIADEPQDPVPSAKPTARPTPAARPNRRTPRKPVEWTLPGICENARITTSFGELPIQALRARDPLRTSQGSIAKVLRVERMQLDAEFLDDNPDSHPIRIPAGCFGTNRPKSDVTVSPHQMVNVGRGGYGADFRRARDLLDRPGVTRHPSMLLSYYVVTCAEPVAVEIEGLSVRLAGQGDASTA